MNVSRKWQDYIDNTLLGSGLVTKAAICHIKDGHQIASSTNVDLTIRDTKQLIKAFTDPSDIRAHGIWIGDVSYQCVRADCDIIIAQIKDGGCVVTRTSHLLIIGIYQGVGYLSSVCQLLSNLTKFLKSSGC